MYKQVGSEDITKLAATNRAKRLNKVKLDTQIHAHFSHTFLFAKLHLANTA